MPTTLALTVLPLESMHYPFDWWVKGYFEGIGNNYPFEELHILEERFSFTKSYIFHNTMDKEDSFACSMKKTLPFSYHKVLVPVISYQ